MENYKRKSRLSGRRKNTDTHRQVSYVNAVIFFGLIVIADIVLLFSHGKVFSENENRMLQQAPAFSLNSLSSGKYMSQFEDFVADQFMLRDNWIYSKLKMDKIIGRKMSNGVYLGGDGYLLEDTAALYRESMENNIASINSFAEEYSGIDFYMSVIPNATEVNADLVPAGAPIRNQRVDINGIKRLVGENVEFIDVLETLAAHNDEQLYYRSDHHWTSLGAKYAFEKIADNMNLYIEGQKYQIYSVADDFSGTMAAASGDFNVTDRVEIYVPDPEVEYYVEYSGDAVKYSSIYNSSALENKNKYEVFFGGNYPKITITTLSDTGRNLLILKDSYANCFIQFLLPHFDKIVIIDPRYYSDDIRKDTEDEKITDVLILYNENTFVQDNSIAGVLEDF